MKILNIGCGNDTYGTDFIDLYLQREEVIKCNFECQIYKNIMEEKR